MNDFPQREEQQKRKNLPELIVNDGEQYVPTVRLWDTRDSRDNTAKPL